MHPASAGVTLGGRATNGPIRSLLRGLGTRSSGAIRTAGKWGQAALAKMLKVSRVSSVSQIR
jgi:hypothetical protein